MADKKKAKEEGVEEIQGVDKDMQERLDGFIGELRPLLGKYEIGIGAVAELTPDGRINAKPIFASTRKPPEAEGAEKVEEQSESKDTAGLSEE